MPARVRTVASHGVDVIDVEAQVTLVPGLPAFHVVGLPDSAVAESAPVPGNGHLGSKPNPHDQLERLAVQYEDLATDIEKRVKD